MDERESATGGRHPDILSTVHEVLSSPERRSILGRLLDSGRAVDVDSLAAEIAAAERGVSVGTVSSPHHERTVVSLVHVHLPKLHDAEFVEWDRENSTVVLAPMVEELSTTSPVAGDLVAASTARPELPEE
jgi:hypothetical protein